MARGFDDALGSLRIRFFAEPEQRDSATAWLALGSSSSNAQRLSPFGRAVCRWPRQCPLEQRPAALELS